MRWKNANIERQSHCKYLHWKCSESTAKLMYSTLDNSGPLCVIFHCSQLQIITLIFLVVWMLLLSQLNQMQNKSHQHREYILKNAKIMDKQCIIHIWPISEKCDEIVANIWNKSYQSCFFVMQFWAATFETLKSSVLIFKKKIKRYFLRGYSKTMLTWWGW